MVWMATILFALAKVLLPWARGSLDPLDQSLWPMLGGELLLAIAVAVLVWRLFENDGIVLIVLMGGLLAGPAWRAVTHFMEVANRPPTASAPVSASDS